MKSLIKKEINLFFSGVSAYLIGIIFFVVNGFVLFVLPTPYNMYDSGVASMAGFFEWIPLVFMFLIPALCMRSFSEEKKSGTLEWLLTKPISDSAVVAGKILSTLIVLSLLLLPSILYKYSISELASPVGNIDNAAFWGAFIGIVLLGISFVSVSIFMSACTKNQMIAFISSIVVCATVFWGFDAISRLPLFGRFDLQIASLGMNHHYKSLSRGVIDIRDVLYYLSISVVFYWACVRLFQRRINKSKRSWIYVVAGILLLQVGAHLWQGRWDMTQDKRYTLITASKQILEQNNEPIYVKVYLTGDIPALFKQLEKSAKELLDEFRIYHPNLRYQFIDIYESGDKKGESLVEELIQKGLEPTQLEVKTKEGLVRRLIFPCAEVSANGKTIPVSLLLPQLGQSAQETLSRSIENQELQFINAIRLLFNPPTKKIAFLEGHGELSYTNTMYAGKELSLFYQTERLALNDSTINLSDYELLIMAKPTMSFTDTEKYLIDQYIMAGGKMLWLINPGDAQMDSLRVMDQFLVQKNPVNWDEVWFRYGFRINPEIVMDLNSCPSPVITGYMGKQPMIEFLPNVYRPVIMPLEGDIEPLSGEFIASIDTLSNSIKKTALLMTSQYSNKVRLPHIIASDLMREQLSPDLFNAGSQIVGWCLEGSFESAFKAVRPKTQDTSIEHRSMSIPTVMVVVGDGNLIKNEFDYKSGTALPTGYDKYAGRLYGNMNFIYSVVHKMCGNEQWIELKNRKISWRLLDMGMLSKYRRKWSIVNIVLPIIVFSAIGVSFGIMRKRRFKR